MPILKKLAQPEASQKEAKSLQLAYSMRRRGATGAAHKAEQEAPAASITEAIMRKRKAATAPQQTPDVGPEDFELEEDFEPELEAALDRVSAIRQKMKAK